MKLCEAKVKVKQTLFSFERVHTIIQKLFDGDMHAKRVISLANGTLGVMTTASLAVSMIGHGLAQARGLATKHSIKQVDRLLSNPAITAWYYFKHWVPYVV